MTRVVLINERRNDIHEISVDISPSKNEIYKILRGKASFLGQWPDEQVVIVKCEPEDSPFELTLNQNRLPRPFTNMIVFYQHFCNTSLVSNSSSISLKPTY